MNINAGDCGVSINGEILRSNDLVELVKFYLKESIKADSSVMSTIFEQFSSLEKDGKLSKRGYTKLLKVLKENVSHTVSVSDYLSKLDPESKEYKVISKLLQGSKRINNDISNLQINFSKVKSNAVNGVFDPKDGSISIFNSENETIHVTHEVVHSVIDGIIDTDTPAAKAFVANVNRLYKSFINKHGESIEYSGVIANIEALTGKAKVKEFIARALDNELLGDIANKIIGDEKVHGTVAKTIINDLKSTISKLIDKLATFVQEILGLDPKEKINIRDILLYNFDTYTATYDSIPIPAEIIETVTKIENNTNEKVNQSEEDKLIALLTEDQLGDFDMLDFFRKLRPESEEIQQLIDNYLIDPNTFQPAVNRFLNDNNIESYTDPSFSLASNPLRTLQDYKLFIRRLFPGASFARINSADLLQAANLFKANKGNSTSDLVKSIISKIWYNYLTLEEKEAIREEIKSPKKINNLNPSLQIPMLSNLTTIPKTVSFGKDNAWQVVDVAKGNKIEDPIQIKLSQGDKTRIYRIGSDVQLSLNNGANWVRFNKDKEVSKVMNDIVSIIRYNQSTFTTPIEDRDIINALALHYTYSEYSDPTLISTGKITTFIEKTFDHGSSIDKILAKISKGEFTKESDRLLDDEEKSIDNLFGLNFKGVMTGGVVNANKGMSLIKDIIEELTSVNSESLPIEEQRKYGQLHAARKIIRIGTTPSSTSTDLIKVLKTLRDTPITNEPLEGELPEDTSARLNRQRQAKNTAEFLLNPMGHDYAAKRLKYKTTFGGPRADYLYRIISSETLDVNDANNPKSLEGLNDQTNFRDKAPSVIKTFLGYLPKPIENSGYYSYNYAFTQALMLFNNPTFKAAWNDKTKTDYTKLRLPIGSTQRVIANKLAALARDLAISEDPKLTIKHIRIFTGDSSVIMYSAKNDKAIIFDKTEQELKALVNKNPEAFDVVTGTSPSDIYETFRTLNPKFSDTIKTQNAFGRLVRQEYTLELFRSMQNYLGSLTKKRYLYLDTKGGNNNYVELRDRARATSVAGLLEELLSALPTFTVNEKVGDKTVEAVYIAYHKELKGITVEGNFKTLITNLNLESFREELGSIEEPVKKDIVDRYNAAVKKINNEIDLVNTELKKNRISTPAAYPRDTISPYTTNKLEAIIKSVVTDSKESFNKLSNLIDTLLEVYTSNSVKDMDGNTIYTYTMSSFGMDNLEREAAKDKSRLRKVMLYAGQSNGDFKKEFMKESSADFALRDLRSFIDSKNFKTYYQTIINQSDKYKSITAQMFKFDDAKQEIQYLTEAINDIKAQYRNSTNNAGITIPILIGNDIQKINIADPRLSTADVIKHLHNGYLDYLKNYLTQQTKVNSSIEYVLKELDKNPTEGKQKLISYINHNFINSKFLIETMAGDVSNFKTDVDVLKRLQGALAPGSTLYTGRGGANTEFAVVEVSDLKLHYDNMFAKYPDVQKLFQKYSNTLRAFYNDMGYETTDGQGIITENRFNEISRGVSKGYGLKGVLKPVIYDGVDSYYKYSAFVLNKSLAEKLGIMPLYEAINMLEFNINVEREKQGLKPINAEFIFPSANKKITNEQKSRTLKLTGTIDTNYLKSVKIISTDNYRLQLNPQAGELSTAFPVQPSYFLSAIPEAQAKVNRAWTNITGILIESAKKQFPEFLELKKPLTPIEREKVTKELNKKLRKYVANRLNNDEYLTKTLLHVGVPLNSNIIRTTVTENLITSLFKEVYDNMPYSSSGNLVMASSALMASNKKPGYRIEEKNGRYRMTAEAIISSKFLSSEQRLLIDNLNTLKGLRAIPKDKLTPQMAESLIEYEANFARAEYPKLIGFRMPTTGLHSMAALEIVDYHNEDAKIIFVPEELPILHGADFDVDKLNILAVQTLNGKVVGENENGIFNMDVPDSVLASWPATQKIAYFKNQIYYTFLNVLEEVGQNGSINELGQHMWNPISTAPVSEAAEEEIKRKKGTIEEVIHNIFLPHTKFQMHEVVSVGRNGVGMFANVAKLKAALIGQKFRVPFVLKVGSRERISYGITSTLDPKTDNHLIIDAFINSAIDNLKELKLAGLDINPRNINIISSLLLMGIGTQKGDVAFMADFIKKNNLIDKTLPQVLRAMYPSDFLKLPTANMLRRKIRSMEARPKLSADEENSLMLLRLALFQSDSVGLIVSLNLLRKGPINKVDLTDANKTVEELMKVEHSDLEGPLPTTFDSNFLTTLTKKNPHIQQMFDYSSWISGVADYADGTGEKSSMGFITANTGLKIADQDAFDRSIADYFMLSKLDLGEHKEDSVAFCNAVLNRLREVKKSETDIGAQSILKKLLVINQRRKGLVLKNFLGDLSLDELYWAQTLFSNVPTDLRTNLMKYLLIATNYKRDDASFAKLFKPEDFKKLVLTKNGETFSQLANSTSPQAILNTLIKRDNIDHMQLALFSRSENFESADFGYTNGVKKTGEEVEDDSNDIEPEEYNEGNSKASIVGTKVVYADMKIITRLPKKEDYKPSRFESQQDNAFNRGGLEELVKTIEKQIPQWKIVKNTLYYRVYLDMPNAIGYYQRVNRGIGMPYMATDYNLKDYFNPYIPTINMSSFPVKTSMPELEADSFFAVPKDSIDRTDRAYYSRVGKTAVFKLSTDEDPGVSFSLAPGDKVTMTEMLEHLVDLPNTLEDAIKESINRKFGINKEKGTKARDKVYKHKRYFDTPEDLWIYEDRAIKLRKIKGKYIEAKLMSKLFGLVDESDKILDEIDGLKNYPPLHAGAFSKSKNDWDKSNLRDSVKWMDKKENIDSIKRRYGFFEGNLVAIDKATGKIVDIKSEGMTKEQYNRRFFNATMNMEGEFDLLFRHDDDTYTLLDIKSMNMDSDYSVIDNGQMLKYGNQSVDTLTRKSIDKARIQTMGYAMALLDSNPDIKFRHIGILPAGKLADAVRNNLKTSVPISDAVGIIKDFYKKDMGVDLKKLNPELVNPSNYDYSRTIHENLIGQDAHDAYKLELQKRVINLAEKVRAQKDFKGQDYYKYVAALDAAEKQYRNFVEDSVIVGAPGLNDWSMYIGSKNRYGDPDVQLWSKEFDKAYLIAIRRKEDMRKDFKKLQMAYLEYKGLGKALLTRGDMKHYTDLMTEDKKGRTVLKNVADLSHPTEIALVNFLNATYKNLFDQLSNDKACVGYNKFTGKMEAMSSVKFQNEVIGDTLEYYEGWMPKVPPSTSELMLNGSVISNVGDKLKNLKDRYLTYHYENEYERLNKFNDMAIPIKYANENLSTEPDKMSMNLEKQFDLFTSWAVFKLEMEHVHALGTAIRIRTEADKDPRIKHVGAFIDKQVQMLIQGIRQRDIVASNSSAFVQGARKLLLMLNSVVSSLLLSFNYIGGIKNALSIVTAYGKNSARQGIARKVWAGHKDYMFDQNIDHYAIGLGLATKAMTDDMAAKDNKLMTMFREYGFSAKYTQHRANDHRYADVGKTSTLKNAATFLYSVPEEVTSMASLYASMKSIKVGNTNLYDAYTLEDGRLVYKGPDRGLYGNTNIQLQGISQEEITKMKYMTELTNGSYRADEKTMLDYSLLGSIFMTFHRTLLGNLGASWQGKHSSAALGNFVDSNGRLKWENVTHEGRWQVLGGILMSFKKGNERYKLKNLSVAHKNQMLQAGLDVLLLLITSILLGGGDKDPEEKNSFQYKLLTSLDADMQSAVFPLPIFRNSTPVLSSVLTKTLDSSLQTMSYAVRGYLFNDESAFHKDGSLKGNSIVRSIFPAVKMLDPLFEDE